MLSTYFCMKHKYFPVIILAVLLSVISAACSEEESRVEPALVTGHCSIVSRSAGDMHVPAAPNELINNWWVVFADASGTVRSIVTSPELSAPVERDEFTVELPAATYTLYAFANLSPEELYARSGVRFITGEKLDTDVRAAVWDNMENAPSRESLIPMSGTAIINFRNNETEFAVELIRMLAKIRVSVKNTTESPIDINTLSFGILNRGAVPLLPDYTLLGNCPDILEEARENKEDLVFEPQVTVGAGEVADEIFYVRESAAVWTHPTMRYFVTFGISRGNGTAVNEHYAVTDELHWIQRNDFIDIPIVISNVTVDWSVLFYPPIGGYPAVVTEVDGDCHFLTFGTPGKFRIRPEIISDGAPVPAGDFGFEIQDIEGDSGIFAVVPAKDSVTGEIIGELSSQTGTAELTCALTLNVGERPTVRVRKLYIIRK